MILKYFFFVTIFFQNEKIKQFKKKMLKLIEKQEAFEIIEEEFGKLLGKELNLLKISNPLFVEENSGLNDQLEPKSEPIKFKVDGHTFEIVQALTKWKRYFIFKNLKFFGKKNQFYEGIYTITNAIRKNYKVDSVHSTLLKQWDWEKIIDEKLEKNLIYLKKIVEIIFFKVLKPIETMVCKKFSNKLKERIQDKIEFVHAEELEKIFPNIMDSSERELKFLKNLSDKNPEKKVSACFVIGLGYKLPISQIPHDGRFFSNFIY